jgi:spermidine synthase
MLGAAAGAAVLGPRRVLAGEEKVLERVKSEFNDIVVTEQGSVRTLYFVVDGRRYIESRLDRAYPQSLDLDYSRTMMAGFLVNPDARSLMMLGLGAGQITNYLYHRFPELEIDGVDIDPEVIRVGHRWFDVPTNDPRYRTHVADGRLFIERHQGRWDQIMLDAFRGVFVPYHLKTQEFYEACLAKLSDRGVVVANLHNMTRRYPDDRESLGSVFPQSYAFLSEAGNQTTYVGSADERRVGAYALRANAARIGPILDFDATALAARMYLHADWRSGQVLKDDFKADELERGIEQHNENCGRDCAYPVQ